MNFKIITVLSIILSGFITFDLYALTITADKNDYCCMPAGYDFGSCQTDLNAVGMDLWTFNYTSIENGYYLTYCTIVNSGCKSENLLFSGVTCPACPMGSQALEITGDGYLHKLNYCKYCIPGYYNKNGYTADVQADCVKCPIGGTKYGTSSTILAYNTSITSCYLKSTNYDVVPSVQITYADEPGYYNLSQDCSYKN